MARYVMSCAAPLLSHGPTQVRLLRDVPDEHRYELRALVASGDYFIELATQLDRISQQLAKADPSIHTQVERIIADLEYVHAAYEIRRK